MPSKPDERELLYPNIDAVKSNLHGNKTVIKKPLELPKKKEEEPVNVPISYLPVLEEPKKKTGVSIAPIQYSKLTDLELERVIRYELKKNPHLIKRHGRILNVKYDVVEKNIHGPKIVNKKHVSKLRVEDEWYE